MKGLRLALALLLAAPAWAGRAAEEDEPPKPTVVDLKAEQIFFEHLYEGFFQGPNSAFCDPVSGEIYVADGGNHLVGIHDAKGVPLFTFGANDQVREPTKVVVDRTGRIYVLGLDRTRINVFNYRGLYLGALELPGRDPKSPIATIALDAEGNFYVGDDGASEVLVYDPSFQLKLRFGKRGEDHGRFVSIAGIAANRLYIVVVDHQGIPVQVFDRRGNYLRSWGEHQMGKQNFSLPNAVALDSKSRVVVVDGLRHEIKFFDIEGNFIDRFGGFGTGPVNVAFPRDVTVTTGDRICIADKGNNRVQVLSEVEGIPKADAGIRGLK